MTFDALFPQQGLIAGGNLVPPDRACHSLSGERAERVRRNQWNVAGLGSLHNRGRQWMLASTLQAGNHAYHTFFRLPGGGNHTHQLRFALRERARLVEREGVNFV